MESRIFDFVANNLPLFAVALVSGGMLLWPLLRGRTGGPWVDTLQATQLINREDALVLDVREPVEAGHGRILGARHVPLGELEAKALTLAKNKGKPVIAYCERGTRSSQALAILRKHGYTNVVNLNGGFAAWQQAGLPVEK